MITEELRRELATSDLSADRAFKILDKASRFWMNGDRGVNDDIEIVIRLLDRANEFEAVLKGAKLIINALARQAGLFPYYERSKNTADNIAQAVHRAPGLSHIYFHAAQREVFSLLEAGKNLVLSAPTSFGKTLLVDALIATKRPASVVIVVPTIALLEERRRRLRKLFPDYQIITQAFQQITEEQPHILLGTQERILERDSLPNADLFVIDEFYKLDMTRGDMRAKSLNILLARYLNSAKQVYLLGPSLDSNPINQESSKLSFFKTDYSPVAANIVYVDPPGTDPDSLARILENIEADSSLVYCRSPKSARTAANEVIERGYHKPDKELDQIAAWLRDNYHPEWYLAEALESGAGIHHGRIPRAIATLLVQLFNAHKLNVLFCTSTLIEGVNTAAKNVLIYDKYVDQRKLDRFTFNNIKGRAGRMFQHYVGNIFLFNHDAPAEPQQLDIPLLSDPDSLPEETIIQLPDEHLSDDNRLRKRMILERTPIPEAILERFGRYGVSEIEGVFEDVLDLRSVQDTRLNWTGLASYNDIRNVAEVVWSRLKFEQHDVRSASQFAFLANRLTRSTSLYNYITQCASEADQYGDIDTKIDKAFNFLRGAEYSFLEPFELVQGLVNYAAGETVCDYSKFLGDLASWRLPGRLKALEEFGIPAPIILRLEGYLNPEDVEESYAIIRQMMDNNDTLEPTERLILSYTLEN